MPEEQREPLNSSRAGVFYREFFCRLDEEPFSVLYADLPSRPNVPVNELVRLEYLKAGFGRSDEEMYEAFLYNLHLRHALGLDEFGTGYLDLRAPYSFRERLSRYMHEKGVNQLDQAFEQVTDEQLAAFQVKTDLQRMDCTMVASDIRQVGRLQLLVEVVQRVQRMLSQADQGQLTPSRQKGGWAGLFDPAICHTCSFQMAGTCPTRFWRTAQRPEIYFHSPRVLPTQRRRETLARKEEVRNPRRGIN